MYFWKYNLVIFNKISELEDDLLVNWRIKILSGFKINLMLLMVYQVNKSNTVSALSKKCFWIQEADKKEGKIDTPSSLFCDPHYQLLELFSTEHDARHPVISSGQLKDASWIFRVK